MVKSDGAYGYPKPQAAPISSRAIKRFLNSDNQIREVRLVFFQPDDVRVFLEYHEFE